MSTLPLRRKLVAAVSNSLWGSMCALPPTAPIVCSPSRMKTPATRLRVALRSNRGLRAIELSKMTWSATAILLCTPLKRRKTKRLKIFSPRKSRAQVKCSLPGPSSRSLPSWCRVRYSSKRWWLNSRSQCRWPDSTTGSNQISTTPRRVRRCRASVKVHFCSKRKMWARYSKITSLTHPFSRQLNRAALFNTSSATPQSSPSP